MTQQETLENNKLIAEFMRWKISGPGFPSGYNNPHNLYCHFEDLEFNHSWNWLMPVVEKIENLTLYCNRDYYFSMGSVIGGKYQCYIEKSTPGMRKPNYMKGCKADTLIQAVYTSVVEFIKYYNQNKTL